MSSHPDSNSNTNYIFKCDKQLHHVTEKLATLYQTGELCDTTLIAGAGNMEVKAHRLVLYLSSEYFRTMFHGGDCLKDSEKIIATSIDGDTLKKIIGFMYTFEIEMSKESIEKVLRAATIFQMKTLIERCCDLLAEQLNANNCLKFVDLAAQHKCTELFDKSLNCAYENFEKVSDGEEFLKLTEPQLSKFLSHNGVNVVSQKTLFLGLIKWLKHDQETREQSMYILLNDFVRFAQLDLRFIIRHAASVAHIAKCSKLLFSWLDWHSSNETSEIVLSVRKTSNKPKIILAYIEDDVFTVVRYDRDLNQWSRQDCPQPLTARTDYEFVIAQDECFIAGGAIGSGYTDSVECLDLKSMKWRCLPPMLAERSGFAMAALNGSLYVVGGSNKTGCRRSMEKYDPADGQWTALPEIPAVGAIAAVTVGGKLYVSVHKISHLKCYDPATNIWSETADRNKNLSFVKLTANEEYVYAVAEGQSYLNKNTVERYNPANNTWEHIASIISRSWPIACMMLEDKLLVCKLSRVDPNIFLEYFDEQTNQWTQMTQCFPLKGSVMKSFICHQSSSVTYE